jgi:predicted PurR-regulated permease PerM
MNKWKIAFWICLALLVLVTMFSIYSIIDQGVTLTYQKEGYIDTENDLDQLIEIIKKTDLTKSQIKNELKNHKLYEYMNFNSDTISLDRVLLIFENDKLKNVTKQW